MDKSVFLKYASMCVLALGMMVSCGNPKEDQKDQDRRSHFSGHAHGENHRHEDHKGHAHGPAQKHEKHMSRNEENILWAKFDSLSDEQKRELINQKRERIVRRDSIAEAKRAEFAAKMKNFDKMSLDEQRALLETREKTSAPMTEEQLKEMNERREKVMRERAAQRKANLKPLELNKEK